jgi:fermentation-respiration switch protein FrsA (DUF1100 family)
VAVQHERRAGFVALKTFRLDAFAEEFSDRGMAVLAFDYRCFGESEGTPRQLVSPRRHLEDWEAAIAHVRSLRDIDHERMALWGLSFSGGHVIVSAARDSGIRAVVSQIPFVDGIATTRSLGMGFVARGTVAAMRDLGRIVTGRRPFCVPVVAEPGTFAVMSTPGSKDGYMALVPEDSPWENEVPARLFLEVPLYRPIKWASRVTCPLLLLMAEQDNLIPPESVVKTASLAPKAELIRLNAGHFDPYMGELFNQVVKIEGDFLEKHLG